MPDQVSMDWTEADTRARFIDPILDRLGWSPSDIKREPYAGWSKSRGYIDYLLSVDDRAMFVLEAKKTGRTFSLPSNLGKVTSFRKLQASGSNDLREALDQCLQYSQHTGSLYACATNGIDWIFFKPTHPHRSLPDAKVILFRGADDIAPRIDKFSDLLSPTGAQEGRTEKELLGREIQVPTFAKRLRDTFPRRAEMTIEEEEYSNILDGILKHYVVELTNEKDFKECYIPAKGNGATSGIVENLVSDMQAAQNQQGSLNFGNKMVSTHSLPNISTGRTVVLHGEVGVGKTSFLRDCELTLREGGKLEQAVWARIDLLPFQDRQFHPENVHEMLNLICKSIQDEVSEATDSMSGRYDPDVWNHLRDIYNKEVRVFQKSKFPDSDDSDQAFIKEARDYVWNLREQDVQEHLMRVIRWLTVNCRLPVIIVLDNSDQLGIEFQEFLYKLTETIKSSSSAVVILVVRTEALESHVIREHSIASVREQFVVNKAPLAAILDRRFQKILNSLPSVYSGSTDKVAQDRISVLMETVKHEANIGSEAYQLIEAAGNGSLRDNLRAVSSIFRSSPRMMDQLVSKNHKEGRARLTVPQVLRSMLKEDLNNAESNQLIPNIFTVDSQVTMPYTLGIRMLQQLRSKQASRNTTVASVLNAFSIAGVDRTIAFQTLTKMRVYRYLAVDHMLTEIRDADVLRLTPLGAALLDIVLSERNYFGGSAFNTYIYRRDVYNNMRSAWTSDTPDYRKKFEAISKQFIEMIIDDDVELRRRLDLSLLEPIVSESLPGELK